MKTIAALGGVVQGAICLASAQTQGAAGELPFRHVIIDRSPDLTRPGKAVGDMKGDGFIDIVAAGSTGLFWYEYPKWTKHVIDPARVENNFCFA